MTDYYASTAIPDGTTGAGTEGDPTSIRHAYEVLATTAGDRILFKNAGSPWSLNVANGSLNCAGVGTVSAPIEVIGYTTTVGDGGLPEIEASGPIEELILADDAYVQWTNVILTGGSRAVHSNGTSDSRGISFTRAWMRDQTVQCVDTAGHTNEPFVFVGCLFENAPIGLEIGGRDAVAIACQAINCSTAGFQVANNNKGAKLIGCLAHSCGIGFDLGNQEAWLYHCAANECTTGVDIAGPGRYLFWCCGITNNGTGVNGAAGSLAQFFHVGTYGNETDVHANVTLQHDVGRVTADPLFVAPAPVDTLEVDLSLAAGSPWRGAGLPAADFLGGASPDIGLIYPSTPPASAGSNRLTVIVGRS